MSDSTTALGTTGPTGRPSTTVAGLRVIWMLGQSRGHGRSEKGQVWRLSWYAHCEISRPCLPHRLRGTQDRPTGRRGPQEGVREGRPRQRASTHHRVRYTRHGSTLGIQRVPPRPRPAGSVPFPRSPQGRAVVPGRICAAHSCDGQAGTRLGEEPRRGNPGGPFCRPYGSGGRRQGRRPCP